MTFKLFQKIVNIVKLEACFVETMKVAILGFGTVGQGIYKVLNEQKDKFKERYGFDVEVVKILVNNTSKERIEGTKHLLTNDYNDVLAIPDLKVVFEAIVNEEPAFTYLKQAIEHRCHVVTANKVMFAKYGATLQQLAKQYGVGVGYEATVAGGTPIIKTLELMCLVNEVKSIQGILNGTTNYILTKMLNENQSFDVALKNAQQLGYAEADPYNDISGQDAFKKLMILSSIAFGEQPDWSEVEVVGIDTITQEDVDKARVNNEKIRHVAHIYKLENGKIVGCVKPQFVSKEHSLYQVDDILNAITVETNYTGEVTIFGPGAGMYQTASVMVEDFIYLYQNANRIVAEIK